MNYCPCQAIEDHFDEAFVEGLLREQCKEGSPVATRVLLEALKDLDLGGLSLLDIGGGAGTLIHALFPEGIERAVLVEMASAYLRLAEEETRRQGHDARVEYVHGDFVEEADVIPGADLVTLDRVVCCYPDMERLIRASVAKSRRWYALSYPREKWYVRVVIAYKNWLRRRRGDSFTTYVHSERLMAELVEEVGFRRVFHRTTVIWAVSIYEKPVDP